MIEELVNILEKCHSDTLTLLKEKFRMSEFIPLLRSIFVSLETLKDVSTICSEAAHTFTLKLKK